jgi:hypothetical protein
VTTSAHPENRLVFIDPDFATCPEGVWFWSAFSTRIMDLTNDALLIMYLPDMTDSTIDLYENASSFKSRAVARPVSLEAILIMVRSERISILAWKSSMGAILELHQANVN